MSARAAAGRDRLIVVSNRLPFTFRQDAGGHWRAEPGGGHATGERYCRSSSIRMRALRPQSRCV